MEMTGGVTGLGETTSQMAQALWMKGEEMGVFLHRQQRPSRLTAGLRALAVWPADGFWFASLLEAAAPAIRAEALAVLGDSDQFVKDGFARAGEWTKYDLYLNGYRHRSHAARCPQTMRAVEQARRARGRGGAGSMEAAPAGGMEQGLLKG